MTSSPLEWAAGVRRRVLPNGLTILIQPDPAAPAVAVVTHVRAGFFDEPDRWQGISHVLEHMFFKGTPTRSVGQIANETKALGGYLNASTGYDVTNYYVVLPADGWRKALEIQADALRNATIDPTELARELRVIIEEAKRKLDTPAAVAHETLHAVLFDRHRIRRWRIGTEPMLAGFTRDDVLGYYRSRYIPGRVIVSVVGNVDPEAAFATVSEIYADWEPVPMPDFDGPDEPWRRGVRARTLRGDVSQAELVVGWRGVPSLDPDSAPLDVLAAVLGSGRGSRLYGALRRPGIVASVGAYHYSPSEVGVFSIAADLAPQAIDRALEGIAREVESLRRGPPSPAELQRAKTILTAQWARRLESVEGRASAFAAAEAVRDLSVLDDEFAAMQAVTPDAVVRVAERYLAPDLVSGVAYVPTNEPSELGVERLARAFAEPGPRPPTGNGSAEVPVARSIQVARGKLVAEVRHLALDGVDLLVRRKPGVPLVSLGVYRRRVAPDQPATAGLGTLAVRSSARGAGQWNAASLADVFERLGGGLSTSIASDWFGFGTSVLSGNLPEAASLLKAVLCDPHFAADEVAWERDTQLEDVIRARDDMLRYPIQLAFRAAYPDHQYGVPVSGYPESVPKLTGDGVVAWHRQEMARGRTTVVAVGSGSEEEMLGMLAAVFGDLPGTSDELPPPARVTPRRECAVETRDKSQTALAMVFPGPARRDPDRHAAMVLATVASGLGGRLFEALRDRRSLAYTVLLSSWRRLGAGALLSYIATSPGREAEAREQMLVELERFRREPVEADELERAVNFLAGQAMVQRQTGGALASEVLDAWLLGTGLEELEDPAAEYRAVGAEAVLEAASRYLDPEAMAEGVVRGRSG